MEQFQTEFPQAEFLQITGGHMSPERIWFKYEPSGASATTDKKTVEKLQERCDRYEKALTESEKMYQKQMDRFLNSEMNESARSHCESQLKLLFPAHKAYDALAAIGNEGSGDE
ncbi:hypothetical protein RU90_GL001597 [Lactococcus lactis subsp. hordniae]|nr:hypothetical protein RU90_GL001597 [Lactococcus lactis subsp. hordniae]